MIKNGQTILTLHSPSCQNFANSKWLSIKFSTLPVGCYGGTSRCYGNNDVIKPWQSNFGPFIPFVPRFQVLARSHNSASNSPQTQWVCHGGTSRCYGNNDVIKPWQSNFGPFIPFVPRFQVLARSHNSASNSPQTQWVCHGGTSRRTTG